MNRLLITNATVFSPDEGRLIENGVVMIQDDAVAGFGAARSVPQDFKDATSIDARGMLAMPGFVNCHHHLYSSFARGFVPKEPAAHNFQDILRRLWWRLDKALTIEDVYFSAATALMDSLRAGTTTVFDHHASPGAIPGILDVITKAFYDVGARGVLCYEVSDRDGRGRADEGIEENVRFARSVRNEKKRNQVSAMFGLHSSFTLSTETLEKCAEAGREAGIGFHLHLAEDSTDMVDSLRRYKKGVVQRLIDSRILSPRTIAAHCVYMDQQDMGLLKDTGTAVVHNPQSNMNNAVGCASLIEMLRLGIRVGLGTDGMSGSVLLEARIATLLHKLMHEDAAVANKEVRALVLDGNPAIAGSVLGRRVGSLAPGSLADLILVDYVPPTPLTAKNAWAHLLFGVPAARVDTVLLSGRIVMRDGRFVGVDEAETLAKAREHAKALWDRIL